jgi:hypothetical protein
VKRPALDPFARLGTTAPSASFSVAEVVQDCIEMGLLDELRATLGLQPSDQGRPTLRAVRDLVYELAGAKDRNLAVDVLVHATGLGEFDSRTLRDYARKHGMTAEGFRRHVAAMRHRLGLTAGNLPGVDAN